MKLTSDLEDELKAHLKSKKPLFGEDSSFGGLLQRMVNTMLEGEMGHHLVEDLHRGKTIQTNLYVTDAQ